MFSEGKTETFVGIVVFTAIILLTIGIIWGKKLPIFTSYTTYKAEFQNVQGVGKGDPVMVHGIKKGEVTDIRLLQDKALIEFRLTKDMKLFQDARVYLEIEELMGGKQLTVYPGTGNLSLDTDKTLHGEVRGDLRVIMANSVLIMYRVDSLLQMMNHIFKEEKVSHLVQNLEDLSFQTKEMLGENRKNINSTISALTTIAAELQSDSTVEHINTALVNLNHAVMMMDTTISLLNPVVERLQNKESTFGKMVDDKKLYQQLVRTTTNLDSLVTDIKKNPKKYIHFSLF